jgi:hydroxymethylpyrimidine/phosphomethylpyrimidine kinase
MNEPAHNQITAKHYRKVLTIAGSDSGGGAGIQADLKTFSAIGCYGMSVITALTAQNTRGVYGIHAVPPAFAVEQINAVLSDIGADAIKIGMLYSAELIEAVAAALKNHGAQKIVIDPVMVAQSGDKLLQDDAVEAIKTDLMPLAEVVTPNLPEAEVLTGQKLQNRQDVESAASRLAAHGSRNILIKGGHGNENQSADLLYLAGENRLVWLTADRIHTRNNHGTGCTLSSAIAAYLAQGHDSEKAVQKAKAFMNRAIAAGAAYEIGNGHGPVHHFFKWWQ